MTDRPKPRVIISSDIGGKDPDDQQSMVHYLVHADLFDTEGLVSSPPFDGRASHFHECIDAYEKDYPNLSTWSRAYPAPAELRGLVRQGAIDIQNEAMPETGISLGARLIIDRAHADDPRPLWVLVWGSATDMAQAVHADPSIKKKTRFYTIGSWNTDMDPLSRAYLFNNHPDLWWVENDTTFRGMYMGGEQYGDLGNAAFPARHVAGHGALGDFFMDKKADIKMGDSPSVLYLMSGDPGDPTTEHWGGAFVRPLAGRPTYWHDNPDPKLCEGDKLGAKTVSKWRVDYLRLWEERMDRVLDV